MTPREYEQELHWRGWRATAMRAFNLRPAEGHALTLLMRQPGRVVTVETLALFDGDGMANSKGFTGTKAGIIRRVWRVREKLGDAGILKPIQNVGGQRGTPVSGFVITVEMAQAIDARLRFACGVEVGQTGRAA